MTISIIAAIGNNRAIGKANKLLWDIPADLARFKDLTADQPLVMGRKTFESILTRNGKPLPGRPHLVVTRNKAWHHEGVYVAHSTQKALELAATLGRGLNTFVIGGQSLFEETLTQATILYITHVDDSPEADAFFPEFSDTFQEFWRKPKPGIHNGITYQFANYCRKKPTK